MTQVFQWVTEVLSSWVKQPGRESDHSLHPYVLLVLRIINDRKHLKLTLTLAYTKDGPKISSRDDFFPVLTKTTQRNFMSASFLFNVVHALRPRETSVVQRN